MRGGEWRNYNMDIVYMRNLITKGPMRLEDALKEFGPQLRHTRAFYVLQPNLEQGEVFKFGVAGISTGNAYNRVNEYRINYGEFDAKNQCKGVLIYYLGVTEYNRLVLAEKSQVFKIELKLKQDYKSTTEERAEGPSNRGTGFRAEGRGAERLKTSAISIQDFLKRVKELNREEELEDEEKVIDKVTRDSSQRFRTDTKSYIDSKTTAERIQKPQTRQRGNFNVTTLPPEPRVTRSKAKAAGPNVTTRSRNFNTTTLG